MYGGCWCGAAGDPLTTDDGFVGSVVDVTGLLVFVVLVLCWFASAFAFFSNSTSSFAAASSGKGPSSIFLFFSGSSSALVSAWRFLLPSETC